MTILVVRNNTAVTDELSEKLRIIKSDTKIVVAIAGIMKMTAENNRDCKKIEFRRFVRSSIFFYGYFSDLSRNLSRNSDK